MMVQGQKNEKCKLFEYEGTTTVPIPYHMLIALTKLYSRLCAQKYSTNNLKASQGYNLYFRYSFSEGILLVRLNEMEKKLYPEKFYEISCSIHLHSGNNLRDHQINELNTVISTYSSRWIRKVPLLSETVDKVCPNEITICN